MPQDEDRRELDGPATSTHSPYVSPLDNLAEFTPKAAVAGIFFGILFGAANAYLGLRVGLTISTSIPVAVLTAAAFKVLSSAGHRSTILEANLSQTIGSASSSVASGVIFTLPALFLWDLAPGLFQMVVLAMCGRTPGRLVHDPAQTFSHPKRTQKTPLPGGYRLCRGASRQSGGRSSRSQRILGPWHRLALQGARGLGSALPSGDPLCSPFLNKSQLGLDFSAALLGVGYILGPRISIIMVSGGLLSWVVLIPAIASWGREEPNPCTPKLFFRPPRWLPTTSGAVTCAISAREPSRLEA